MFGPATIVERGHAPRLLPVLGKDMLLLTDRGFDSNNPGNFAALHDHSPESRKFSVVPALG